MPKRPDDPTIDEDASFLRRWSERKARSTEQTNAETIPETAPIDPGFAPEQAAIDTDPEGAADNEPTAEAPPEVTESDLENLTYESDYTKFMGEDVPEALRRRALRQLWRSDPILANVDGLCDYDDDYTDSALAVTFLKTAHKVGQGYLTDEEVEANRARGRPAKPADNPVDEPVDEVADDEHTDADDDLEECEDVDEELVAGTDTDTIDTAHSKPNEHNGTDDAAVNLTANTLSPKQAGNI